MRNKLLRSFEESPGFEEKPADHKTVLRILHLVGIAALGVFLFVVLWAHFARVAKNLLPWL